MNKEKYGVAINSYTLNNITNLVERKAQLSNKLGYISNNLNPIKYNLKQIFKHIGSGGHIILGEFESYRNDNNARVIKRNNNSFISTHFLAVDLDDTDCTIAEILEHSLKSDLMPIFYYETLSHNTPHKDPEKAKSANNNRYRLIYLLDEPITSGELLEDVNKGLYETFKTYGADSAATDVARLFLGTDKSQRAIKAIKKEAFQPVTTTTVLKLAEQAQKERLEQQANKFKQLPQQAYTGDLNALNIIQILGTEIGALPYENWKNMIFSIRAALIDLDHDELLSILIESGAVDTDKKAQATALTLIQNYDPTATNPVTKATLIKFAKDNGYDFKADLAHNQAERIYKGEISDDELKAMAMCLNATVEPRQHVKRFLQRFKLDLLSALAIKTNDDEFGTLTLEDIQEIVKEATANGFKFKPTAEQLGLKKFTSNQIQLKGEYLTPEDIQEIKHMKGNILLQSYAGTGKTYTLMQMLDEYLFLVPTRAILNDLANKHTQTEDVIFVGGGLGGFDESVLEYKKIVMTYDQFEQYLKYCSNTPKHKRLIIDECHKLGQYSNITTEKAKKLQLIHDKTIQFAQRIYVSATVYNMPDIFDYVMSFYRPQGRPIKVYQLEKRPHKTKANPSKEYFSALKQILDINKKSFILCNMVKLEEIEKLAELLAAHFDCKIDIIHSKSKENGSYKHIFKGKDKGKVTQIVLATSLLNVGVDMQGTFEHSYIIGTHDQNDIEQAINRERQAEQFFIILPFKDSTTLTINRDIVHITPKKQTKTIKTEQEIALKVPYTTNSLTILGAKDVTSHDEKQYTERVSLYNDSTIKKTLNGEFETDLFIVQAEIYQAFIRNNMTTSTLLELLKPIYPNLDTAATTLATDFDEPTQSVKRDVQDITGIKAKDIASYMDKVELAISTAKKDVFKGYPVELLESVEFDLLTTLARNIAIAEALDNHLAEEPIKNTIPIISKESKNLELWDCMLEDYNTINNTNFTVIADIIDPILNKELSPKEYKDVLNGIKGIYSHVLTSRYSNKSIETLLTERLGYEIKEHRTTDKRFKLINRQ